MLRKLLTVVLPLLLPFLIYGLYLVMARRKARQAGTGSTPRWQEAPWTVIIFAAVGLTAASLLAWRLTSGVPPGSTVVPPRYIDGEIVPGRAVE